MFLGGGDTSTAQVTASDILPYSGKFSLVQNFAEMHSDFPEKILFLCVTGSTDMTHYLTCSNCGSVLIRPSL